MRLNVFFWVGWLFCGGQLGAVEVSVAAANEALGDQQAETNEIHGTLSVVPKSGPEIYRAEIRIPWNGRLDLAPETGHTLTVQAPGYWAGAVDLVSETKVVAVTLLPAVIVSGRIMKAQDALDEVELRFREAPPPQSPARQTNRLGLADTSWRQTCQVIVGQFKCKLPARLLDLRVSAKGFAPWYFWHLDLASDSTRELGPLKLVHGSSLVGWAEAASGQIENYTIELKPALTAWSPNLSQRERIARRNRSSAISDRGFFQFSGIEAGAFEIFASSKDRDPVRIGEVGIDGVEAVLLDQVLEIPPLRRAEILIDPPTDVFGKAWKVRLHRQIPRSNAFEVVRGAKADSGGIWQQDGLEQGEYLLDIQDSEGSTWHESSVVLAADSALTFVAIDLLSVRGSLQVGDEPLAARMVFGGHHRPRIIIFADKDGRFEGSLPRAGRWEIHLEDENRSAIQILNPQTIEKRPGKSYAEIDIRLPDTRVQGRVYAAEEPVAGARIVLRGFPESQQRFGNYATDDEGRFEVRGLEPGTMAALALHGKSSSDWQMFDLHEDSDGPNLRFDLEESVSLRGRVSYQGQGIPGSRVVASPTGVRFLPRIGEALSGADGRFEVDLPKTTEAADLMVIAPGFGIRWSRQVLLSDDASGAEIEIEIGTDSGKLRLYQLRPFDDYILRHRGTELDLEMLRRQATAAGLSEVDDQGARVIRGTSSGAYSFCRVPVRSERDCAHGILAPHGELILVAPQVAKVASDPESQTQK